MKIIYVDRPIFGFEKGIVTYGNHSNKTFDLSRGFKKTFKEVLLECKKVKGELLFIYAPNKMLRPYDGFISTRTFDAFNGIWNEYGSGGFIIKYVITDKNFNLIPCRSLEPRI